jgi:hypothetical protein
MHMPKVLLFCPTYALEGVLQIWPDSLNSYNKLLAPEGVTVERLIGLDNPYPEGKHKNTLHQYQLAQKKMLDESFDALCTFEHDMIVPEDGLIKLWDTPADMVYGLYLLRHGAYVVNAFQKMEHTPNIGQSLSFYPKLYQKAEEDGFAVVSGCGMGFTLIRRPVLERFQLRKWETNEPPDWALAHDCQAAGILQIVRFDVKCGHIDDEGRILRPGKEPNMLVKVKVLQHFVGDIGHGSQVFEVGDEVEGMPDLALEFVRAGFMVFIEDFPQVKVLKKLRNLPVETATARRGEISQPPAAKRKR